MKTIKDFCISFSIILLVVLGLLAAGCETTGRRGDENEFGEDRVGQHPGKVRPYQGLAFTVQLPPNVLTNRKQTPKEVVHYFFTRDMSTRKVGMGIYEGVDAKSMVRYRKDLIPEDSKPVDMDRFVGSQQGGVTFRGKRWREYLLFPQNDSSFAVQIWYFDVEPEDEHLFLQIIQTLRATYKMKD